MARSHPHSGTTPEMTTDNDDEYELEPIDPEILELERQRAEAKVRQAQRTVDINEVYEDQNVGENFTWDDLQGFRFTIRHLLIGTAALAVFLTLFKIAKCLGVFLGVLGMVAAGWVYVLRKEKRLREARIQGREELQRQLDREEAGGVDYSEFDEPDSPPGHGFRFSFSMKELLGAMTVAALLLGAIQGLGGTENAALVLGAIALLGLVVNLVGFEPPPVLVLGWWLLIAMYIVVSLWAAFGSAMA